MKSELKIKEYELLQKLEIETTKIRHTTFTALLSISFLIPGFSLKINSEKINFMIWELPIDKMVFLLGFIFYVFAVFHYNWYHRYSHRYRKRLKELESEIGFLIYTRRVRPIIASKFKMHFDWILYIIGLFYGLVTAIYVGKFLLITILGIMILIYLLLVLSSFKRPIEPLEK